MLRKIAGRGSGGSAGLGFVSMLALSGSGRRKPSTTTDTISHSPSSVSLANHCRPPAASRLSSAQRATAASRVIGPAYRRSEPASEIPLRPKSGATDFADAADSTAPHGPCGHARWCSVRALIVAQELNDFVAVGAAWGGWCGWCGRCGLHPGERERGGLADSGVGSGVLGWAYERFPRSINSI